MGDLQISASAIVVLTALLGSLASVVALLYRSMIGQYEQRLREHKEIIRERDVLIKEQAGALKRLSDVIESWTPVEQRQSFRRSVEDR